MTNFKKDVCEVPVCSYTRRRRGRLGMWQTAAVVTLQHFKLGAMALSLCEAGPFYLAHMVLI